MEQPLDFEFSADQPTILVLRGPLDADTVAALAAALRSRPETVTDIDGSGLTYIGAAGINLFVELARDGPIRVIGPMSLRRLIEICGLSDQLLFEPDDGS